MNPPVLRGGGEVDGWEQRFTRVARGEYPQQVYPKIETLVADLRLALDGLAAARLDAQRTRGLIGGQLGNLLLESENLASAFARKIEAARFSLKEPS